MGFYLKFKKILILVCFVAGNDEHAEEDIKAAMAEIEKELHSAVDKFWGKKCVLSVQCSHFYIDDNLIQVATCDKGTGYTGQVILWPFTSSKTSFILFYRSGWLL